MRVTLMLLRHKASSLTNTLLYVDLLLKLTPKHGSVREISPLRKEGLEDGQIIFADES
jgi:hypothetical protein